jgi:predicted nucleotidyltransferase
MRIIGMICECDPLHRGHLYCMEQARRAAGGDAAVVCVMSGNFVQRGEFAVLNKFARAESLVRGGADLVLELPTLWAIASAEAFARGGVQMLCDTGIVTDLVFGSESGDLAALDAVAQVLRAPAFQEELRAQLAPGVSYPVARARAVAARGGDAAVLDTPNNILGVEYLKALYAEQSTIRPMTVRRVDSVHDGAGSASAVRALLRAGKDAAPLLPECSQSVLRREMAAGRAPVFSENCERAILARLRQMTEAEFAAFDEGGEGLYHRLYDVSRTASSVAEVLAAAKTKRYPLARLRRMVLQSYLNLPRRPERPPYLRLLAANGRGREMLGVMRGRARVLTKAADVAALGEKARRVLEAEARATDLYTLAYPTLAQAAGGAEWRQSPFIL